MELVLSAMNIFLVILPHLVFGCTPTDQEYTLSQLVDMSNVVLLGTVRRTYSNPNLPGNAYTAEMSIECVLKHKEGYQVNAIHNISHAGVVAGRCHSAELLVDTEYIVFGYITNDNILPMDSPLEATPVNMQNMQQICGLSPILPTGFQGLYPRCPTDVDDNGCLIVYDYATEPTIANGDHDHDHDHDHGHDHDHDHDHGHDHATEEEHMAHDHPDHDHHHDHDGHTHGPEYIHDESESTAAGSAGVSYLTIALLSPCLLLCVDLLR